MCRSVVVVDEHAPRDALEPRELASAIEFLLVVREPAALLTRMSLPHDDIDELDLLAEPSVELFQRLN